MLAFELEKNVDHVLYQAGKGDLSIVTTRDNSEMAVFVKSRGDLYLSNYIIIREGFKNKINRFCGVCE